MVRAMHDRMQRLHTTLPDLGDAKPSVLYSRGSAESLDVGGGASYNHFVAELVGGHNPAAGINDSKTTIDTEQLLKWDPEIVLLGNFGPATPATWYSDPTLASLRAVRERRDLVGFDQVVKSLLGQVVPIESTWENTRPLWCSTCACHGFC